MSYKVVYEAGPNERQEIANIPDMVAAMAVFADVVRGTSERGVAARIAEEGDTITIYDEDRRDVVEMLLSVQRDKTGWGGSWKLVTVWDWVP